MGVPLDGSVLQMFLRQVDGMIFARNGAKLSGHFVIEPDHQGNFPGTYPLLIEYIKINFLADNDDALEQACIDNMSSVKNGADEMPWNEFGRFMVAYLRYLTLVDVKDLLSTYDLLTDLVQKCTSALRHSVLGIVALPTVIKCSQALASFAMVLDKHPDLTRDLIRPSYDDEEGSESIPERCANIIRAAIIECFRERSGPSSDVDEDTPYGKRIGVYVLANLCLKVLFQCDQLGAVPVVVDLIYEQAPPLHIYPKAHQITYLYYLGRFHFATSHFYDAQAALTTAFGLCPKSPYQLIDCRHQLRLILIYLIASNIVLGRFPSPSLWQRPEIQDLRPRFEPLCTAIRKGDITSFRRLTDVDNEHAPFFLRYRILFQIKRASEIIIWRNLMRRTFLLVGQRGDTENRKAPTLDLDYVLQLMRWMERPMRYVDPDFADEYNPGYSFLDEGRDNYVERNSDDDFILPNMLEVECMCAAMIHQGLLGGFVSHKLRRFAITGARSKGPLAAGFPRVWDVVRQREMETNPKGYVTGWKKGIPGEGEREIEVEEEAEY
ncbi:hypothetical protein NA57DRAFT_35156 [Rhizodiscina lignyota]|uniref:Uncharacterized protein n=1 Tax=Rhizodiscina lignyota TaxID=1504668 RepID=A0A9P4M8M3_9PEZI|nr:hypothetical protein NA57DRAFT_35156 [Rhizodiscina lignyota]